MDCIFVMSCPILCNVVSGIMQCVVMSYPVLQCRTRRCNVVPEEAMSYTEMQCRTQKCNVVPGVVI